jgi:hypothetical protein
MQTRMMSFHDCDDLVLAIWHASPDRRKPPPEQSFKPACPPFNYIATSSLLLFL